MICYILTFTHKPTLIHTTRSHNRISFFCVYTVDDMNAYLYTRWSIFCRLFFVFVSGNNSKLLLPESLITVENIKALIKWNCRHRHVFDFSMLSIIECYGWISFSLRSLKFICVHHTLAPVQLIFNDIFFGKKIFSWQKKME